jgi:hypothetical protein
MAAFFESASFDLANIGDIKLTGITFRDYFSSHVFVYAKGGWVALWKGA